MLVRPFVFRVCLFLVVSLPACDCSLSLSLSLSLSIYIYIYIYNYKVTIKPIWTYGIELWGVFCTSNIEIMERYELKALLLITDAPWCVPNAVIRNELQIPAIKEG
jgi:hypothetical protein